MTGHAGGLLSLSARQAVNVAYFLAREGETEEGALDEALIDADPTSAEAQARRRMAILALGGDIRE